MGLIRSATRAPVPVALARVTGAGAFVVPGAVSNTVRACPLVLIYRRGDALAIRRNRIDTGRG